MNQSVEERQGLLKQALTSNAVFSVLSGVVILSANRWGEVSRSARQSQFGHPGNQPDRVCHTLMAECPQTKNKDHRRLGCGHHGYDLGGGQLCADFRRPLQRGWKVGRGPGSRTGAGFCYPAMAGHPASPKE